MKCVSVLLGLSLSLAGAASDGDRKTASESDDRAALNADEEVKQYRQARAGLTADPFRPLYHFSPPGYGLHDPAGLCFWQGKYHLFYLYSPPGVKWGRGHAVSDDLVHWQDLPIVNLVVQGGTGQVWADDDKVILGYAAPTHGETSIAVASDALLLDWKEHPANPVLKRPRGNDNFIWKEAGRYFMTVRRHVFEPGRTYLSGHTSLELFASDDLANWETKGPLFEDGFFTEPGEDCGCNNFLPIGSGKHAVIFFSHKRSAQYYTGTFNREQGRFTIEDHGRMNYGPVNRGSLHAPSAFVNPKGRLIGIWNVQENRSQKGWNEIMSLPRELSLNGKGGLINPLRIEPVAELQGLRFDPVKIENVTIPANGETALEGVHGKAMELEAVIDPMKAREVGLHVLRSANGEEQTTITLFMHGWPRYPNCRELAIDVSRASLDPEVRSRSPEIGPLYLEDGKPLRLRVFIDRSVVEVFANGRQCLTLRAYPSREDSTGVSVFARGSEAKLLSLTAWQMRSIWPELKHMEGK